MKKDLALYAVDVQSRKSPNFEKIRRQVVKGKFYVLAKLKRVLEWKIRIEEKRNC